MRLEMLEEAVEVIRLLWQGGEQSHRGRHYTVENARVYDLPDEPPPILVSGFGPKAIELAARIGDGCTTSPDEDAIDLYRSEAAQARCTPGPRSASWTTRNGAGHRPAPVAERGPARRARPGPPDPATSSRLRADHRRAHRLARRPDLDEHAESLQQYADAGVDELFVQQIGPTTDALRSP